MQTLMDKLKEALASPDTLPGDKAALGMAAQSLGNRLVMDVVVNDDARLSELAAIADGEVDITKAVTWLAGVVNQALDVAVKKGLITAL